MEHKMKLKEILKKSTSLFVASCMAAVCCSGFVDVKAESYSYGNTTNPKSLSNLVVPTVISKGSCCSVSGTMSKPSEANSDGRKYSWQCGILVYPIEYISSGFVEKVNNKISNASREVNLGNSRASCSLSDLDYYIQFDRLSSGKYGYTVYNRVAEKGGSYGHVNQCYNGMFVVKGGNVNASSIGNMVLTDYTLPSTIYYGNCFSLSGNVGITYNYYKSDKSISKTTQIKEMYAEIKSSSNTMMYFKTQTLSDYLETSRIIAMPRAIDTAMKFNKLSRGSYKLRYTLANYRNDSDNYAGNHREVINQSFKVK